MPKYIGPYPITWASNKESRYTIQLPEELVAHRVHPTFHISLLRPYIKNDDKIFPKWEANTFYNFGNKDNTEWLIDEILSHQWNKSSPEFLVKWNLGNMTWELLKECKELWALDSYLELLGIKDVRQLLKQEADHKGKGQEAPPQRQLKRRRWMRCNDVT